MLRIEPRRTPVRIRLKSGESEHSSLASLKLDFKVTDVKAALVSGALKKWLRQNGETDKNLQEILEKPSESRELVSYRSLYKAFFPEAFKEMNGSSLADLYHYWEGKPEYKTNLNNLYYACFEPEETELAIIFLKLEKQK